MKFKEEKGLRMIIKSIMTNESLQNVDLKPPAPPSPITFKERMFRLK